MRRKRKQTARKTRKLTRREGILLEYLCAGSSITTAARKAGFSKKWPGQAGYQAYKNIQRKMPKLLDELGLSYKARMKKFEHMKRPSNQQIEGDTTLPQHPIC